MDTIRLYHSTRFENLASILRMGVMTTNNHHSEGHGDMLWFTTSDDYGSDVRISIDVPKEEFDNGKFEFVNKIHVVTYNNVDIRKYNFKIDSFGILYLQTFGAYYGGFNGGCLVRLANNTPKTPIEEATFKSFYQEFGKRKDIRIILDYIKNNSTVINEGKKMKKNIKINEAQLRTLIRESLRKLVLKEGYVRGTALYSPADNELPFDVETVSEDLASMLFKNYEVTFSGYSEPSVNQYGYGEGYPGSFGSVKVIDDGGFSNVVKYVSAINKEWGTKLMSDFQDWCSRANIEWEN